MVSLLTLRQLVAVLLPQCDCNILSQTVLGMIQDGCTAQQDGEIACRGVISCWNIVATMFSPISLDMVTYRLGNITIYQ